MTAWAFLGRLRPIALGLALVALVIAAILLGRGVGLSWDPFGLGGRRLRTAEAAAIAGRSEAVARELETAGQADVARRLDHLHRQAVAVERATAEAAANARSAPDASTPLDPARAARLLHHDRELCRLSPAVCGAAPPDPAGGGDEDLRP